MKTYNTHNASEFLLPEGVSLVPLTAHADERGSLTEMYRESWADGLKLVQWNAARSQAGVIRGVHVHVQHTDYLVVLAGRLSAGLRDLRSGSPTEGRSCLLSLGGDEMVALSIPPGIAHGFYFHEPAVYVTGASHVFDPNDDLGCSWRDPELEIPWPVNDAVVSNRDGAAPSLSALLHQLSPHQPLFKG